MAENTQAKKLFQDALSGRIDRREVIKRGAALGLSAPVAVMLAQASVGAGFQRAMAAEEGKPSTTFFKWMLDLHPTINTLGEETGVNVEEAPTTNFGNERFVAEALEEKSTWDSYGGVTPFLEMIALVDTGTIEPWDAYLPAGLLDDFVPATRAEGTYNGGFYVWPLLLDVAVQARNAAIIEKAGLDPEVSPATWDEYIASAQQVKDSGAAPYGCTFDYRDWRSLIPVTHSISTEVYSPDGLFLYNSDAALEALEILKRMVPLASADVVNTTNVDNNAGLADEASFSAEQVGYYFKYQNAPMRTAAVWQDPSKLRIGPLPKTANGVGGTVFWDTGAVLFKYGFNKQAAVDFMLALSKDVRIWKDSITGNEDEGTVPVGQLPVLQSLWTEWETTAPDYLTANPWAKQVFDGLANASAIAPNILSIKQFDTARPEWLKYLSGEESDPKAALTKAYDAVRAEYKKQTGKDAQ